MNNSMNVFSIVVFHRLIPSIVTWNWSSMFVPLVDSRMVSYSVHGCNLTQRVSCVNQLDNRSV